MKKYYKICRIVYSLLIYSSNFEICFGKDNCIVPIMFLYINGIRNGEISFRRTLNIRYFKNYILFIFKLQMEGDIQEDAGERKTKDAF